NNNHLDYFLPLLIQSICVKRRLGEESSLCVRNEQLTRLGPLFLFNSISTLDICTSEQRGLSVRAWGEGFQIRFSINSLVCSFSGVLFLWCALSLVRSFSGVLFLWCALSLCANIFYLYKFALQ